MFWMIPFCVAFSGNPVAWEVATTDIFHVKDAEKILIDPAGHLFIPRLREGRFAHFDSNGVFVGFLGSQGEGPGEFRLALQLFCDKKPGYYYALGQLSAGKLHRFTREGVFVNSLPLPRGSPFAYKVKTGWLFPQYHRGQDRQTAPALVLSDPNFGNQIRLFQLPSPKVETTDPSLLRRQDHPLFRVNRNQSRIFVYLPGKAYLEVHIVNPHTPHKRHRFTSTRRSLLSSKTNQPFPHLHMMRMGPQNSILLQPHHREGQPRAMPMLIDSQGLLFKPAYRADTLYRLIDIRGGWAWIMNLRQGELGIAKVRLDHADDYAARNPLSY